MRRVSIALIAAVSTVAFTQFASAADLPVKAPPPVAPPPVYNWTGWYVGLNAGAGWGHSDTDSVFSCPGSSGSCIYNNVLNLAAFNAAGSSSLSDTFFVGGIQTGYNWQSGSLVLGGEVDFNSFNFDQSSSVSGLVPNSYSGESFSIGTEVKTNWLFTARGRLGWAIVPTWLVYATGGLAVTDIEVSNSFSTTGIGAFGGQALVGASSSSKTKAGWTVGGGVETALSRNWTVKAEYLYVDFGSVSTTLTTNAISGNVPNVMTASADLRANIARVGVNYRF